MMKTNNQENNEDAVLIYIKLFVIVLILIFYAEAYREYWTYYDYCDTYWNEVFCYYCSIFYN